MTGVVVQVEEMAKSEVGDDTGHCFVQQNTRRAVAGNETRTEMELDSERGSSESMDAVG